MRVTAGMVARVRALAEPKWSPDGAWLAYLESFDGRGDVIVTRADGSPAVRLTADPGAQPTASYGGGILNWLDAETVIFVAPDGQLHALPVTGGPTRQLTRLTGRISAPTASPDGRWIACMATSPTQQHIVVVDPRGEEWARRVSREGDFVFDPSWSSDGSLAWQEWSVPDMAWDASRIWLLTPDGERKVVDGGRDGGADASSEPVSAIQPRFSPDGTYLAYLSDRSGWWNLWLYNTATGQRAQLIHDEAEQGSSTWGPGGMRYAWSPDGTEIAVIRTHKGASGIHLVNVEKGTSIPRGPQDGSVQAVSWSPKGDRLAVIYGRADVSTCLGIVQAHPNSHNSLTTVAVGAPAGFEAAQTPLPEAVSWKSSDGATVHGLLYLPAGVEKPPLIVRVHGGPTGHVEAGFDARTSYYLDRGWAVLQVNYRGSSGYGRAYRQALHGTWGVLDVEDTVSGAKDLAARGVVDGDRMVVMGGSAGGYTVLLCLELHPDVFAAGVDLYGVADLFTLSEDTHRFEAHYLDTIVGPLPETYARYRERSPVTLADKITRPLLILQGDKDDVVPLAQSEAIYKKLQQRGVEVEMKVYEGEGHGWRKLATVLDELERVDKFLRKHVLHVATG